MQTTVIELVLSMYTFFRGDMTTVTKLVTDEELFTWLYLVKATKNV